jgi:hypothetical protein
VDGWTGGGHDIHNKHLSSHLVPSLFPPLQEQVTLFPLAVHVAVCSASLQNSVQSSSSSLSQLDWATAKDAEPVGRLEKLDGPKSKIEFVYFL